MPSRVIVKGMLEELHISQKEICVSVASSEGEGLYDEWKGLRIHTGRMNLCAMLFFIIRNRVAGIIDASHPFADIVSRNATRAASLLSIPYLRYDRKAEECDRCKYFDTLKDLQNYLLPTRGKILLTTGSKDLDSWKDFDLSRIVVRVLPVEKSIRKCLGIGLSYRQILAISPPFSYNLNRQLLMDYHIRYLVTKDSGAEGGVHEKVKAALDENITVCCLRRPTVHYPNVETDRKRALQKIQQMMISPE